MNEYWKKLVEQRLQFLAFVEKETIEKFGSLNYSTDDLHNEFRKEFDRMKERIYLLQSSFFLDAVQDACLDAEVHLKYIQKKLNIFDPEHLYWIERSRLYAALALRYTACFKRCSAIDLHVRKELFVIMGEEIGTI